MRIVFFAGDLNDAAQQRRIRDCRRLGHEVRSMSFRKPPPDSPVDWPNLDLGRVAQGRLARRALTLGKALARSGEMRRSLAGADLLIARNLDMALLALGASVGLRRRPPIVYECLDIHGIFTSRGPKARLARWLERQVLTRSALLLTSSPGFLEHYFAPVQRYTGAAAILENRLPLDMPQRPRRRIPPRAPLRLGWVGAIRCGPSFDLLMQLADRMGPRIDIRIHGQLHRHALRAPDARIAGRANVHYAGPYSYPEGLERVYADCDLVWAQDLWQRGANSDWLLPNRLYEASWYGCPSLAAGQTQTAQKIRAEGLGFVVERAEPDTLVRFLDGLSPARLRAASAALLRAPDTQFCQSEAALAALLEPAAHGRVEPGVPSHA
ncbi:glycosyltransferase [Poseidonocella sedimentorum]|uniref:Succinoglycan biosynthesis protein ExoL n=1 Tax=Poseidonocella sedimentorum TaxID=871652 RepID=A0A1I6DVK0_9RHOB|nr:glycosyltransferase [Poseidonocella sedimentorum]SFR09524.1 succinoglycan biosynthesis protein ExoL [Poseidonocella sedimentorum]